MIISLVIVLLTFWVCYKYSAQDFSIRIFLVVFLVSTLYYGIFGTWYWLEYKEGVFIGVSWGDELGHVRGWFIGVFVVVAIGFAVASRRTKAILLEIENNCIPIGNKTGPMYKIFVLVGLLASTYVLIQGGSVADGAELTDDPFLLIMYQFSDILIAVILYLISIQGLTRRNVTFFLTFCMYGIFVGLRYKVLLVAVPVLIYLFVVVGKDNISIKAVMILIGFLFTGIMSLLTVVRTKFSGIDVDALGSVDPDDMLYGLFAETNIIFGLASSLSTFGVYREFVGFAPIIDSVVQFVPRFLYPGKSLYSNLDGMLFGLGNSAEAYQSATMMPFFAEYYSMGGMVAVGLGLLFYILISIGFTISLRRVAMNFRSVVIGGSLMAIFMAYYYYSRGSIPQIFKGIVFVYLPYLHLLNQHKVIRES